MEMTKYLSLKENEELIIGMDQKPKVVRIKNKNNKLQICEITPEEITDNVVITELNFDELKSFVLYESYYQEISSLDIDKETMQKNNDICEYHYKKIYGNNYSQNISNTKFQVIMIIDKNH